MTDLTLDHIIAIATAAAIGYLLGSIPFGLLLTKFSGLPDIRSIGSGNIGATNVLRTGKKGLAAATLLLDGAKGALAVGVGALIMPWLAPVAGLAALVGHIFPVWLKFNGGKGVATAIGIFLAASWPVGLIAIAAWLLMALLMRYSSLAALAAMIVSPLAALFFASLDVVMLTIIVGAFVWMRHWGNIQRLLAGIEPRINPSSAGRKKA
ncbi:MAG: glycerol-3-phosphate 1-O-acyltransferase PlsY [Alphaproteobacteria bacterium]|nr:glycerol-3-phosphate 1-O-acyltransferase PlsY [Alphaproteobacteria bacterium]